MTKSVYIKLFHGRDDPEQDMDDWGYDGPTLGPFEAVCFTYCTHVRCFTDENNDEELCLSFHDGMLVHDGKYYGDFEVVAKEGGTP